MVAKLERVALREALPQRVVECAALEMRLHPTQPVWSCSCKALFYLDIFAKLSVMCRLVSSAASELGSKMVATCSVSVPRTGRED